MRFLPFLLRILAVLAVSELVSGACLFLLSWPPPPWHEVVHFGLMAVVAAPLLYAYAFRPLLTHEMAGEHRFTDVVLDTIPALVVVLDGKGRIIRFNHECQRVTGYSEDEVLGRPYEFLVPENARGGVAQVFTALVSGEQRHGHENPWLTRDGHERVIRWFNSAEFDDAGKTVGVVAAGIDVTEEIEASRVLQLFRAGIERSGEVIFLTDPDGEIMYVNPAFTQVYGYTPAEALGQTPRLLKSGVQPKHVYERFWDTLLDKKVVRGDLVNRAKDGRLLDIEGTANPVLDEHGEIVAFLAVQRDVTERRATEDALRDSEGRFRTLMEKIPEGVGALDIDTGVIRYANPALCRMLGYDEAELRGRPIAQLQHPEDQEGAPRPLQEVLAEGADRGGHEVQGEHRLVHRSGAAVSVEMTPRVVQLGDGPALLCIVRDITDRKRLEEHLHQSQKLEAVGQLAGGIAHDFNNLLTIIQANAELLRRQRFDGQDEVPAEVGEVEVAVRRGKELVRRLFAFSRREALTFRPVDMPAFLADLERPLRRLVPESIDIRVEIADDVQPARAHVGSLEQVIINLATNARDAMPDGGVLAITATMRTVTEHDEGGRPGGRYVCLTVTDTGMGMTPQVREHIFEPFFTTKPVGKGTGLGMAAVYGLVQQHRGFVSVYSEPGQGTSVRVNIPVASATSTAEADGRKPRKTGAQGLLGGNETILVVEDEDALRRAAIRSLSLVGYTVLAAQDGVEALEVFRSHRDDIDLVLTDLVMPRMGGREFADAVRLERPRLPVVFASGYDADAAAHPNDAQLPGAFLQKPWTLDELTRVVRASLDEGSAP